MKSNLVNNLILKKKLISREKYIIFFYSNIINKIIIFLLVLIISFLIKLLKIAFIKKLKVCLCVIGKKENNYVQEFIEHYKRLGYDKIFIYDNNDVNDERFEDVIQKEIDIGFVSIINYRGLKKMQFKSYKECYKNYNKNYDWLSFFDFDEFLEIKPSNIKIQDFFGNPRFKKCQNIKINWVFYSYRNILKNYKVIPLQKRNNYTTEINKHIKSTIRGNLSENYWSDMLNPHSSNFKLIACSSSGKIVDYKSPFNIPPDIKYAFLKHYHYKSFEEYCIKIKRGKADSLNVNLFKKLLTFYKINKNEPDKVNIMKRIFNLSLISH